MLDVISVYMCRPVIQTIVILFYGKIKFIDKKNICKLQNTVTPFTAGFLNMVEYSKIQGCQETRATSNYKITGNALN